MEIVYKTKEIEEQCTSLKAARKLFGGDETLVVKLMSRINSFKAADTIKDIIVQRQFRFHKLENKGKSGYEGYFAVDVKTSKEPWRIIIRPLKSDKNPYVPCSIDEIADEVKVIEVSEVSKHYE